MTDERLIVTAAYGRAGALCRVLRETPTRFYVEVLDWGERKDGKGLRYGFHRAVDGRSEKPYVTLESVAFDGVTQAEYAEYKRLYYAREDAIKAATKAAEDAYLESLRALWPDKTA